MKAAIVILPCLVAGVFGASRIGASNRYVDELFHATLPRMTGLEGSRLHDFALKVESNSVTNRDVKAEFHDGRMVGTLPPNGIRRDGNCSPPRIEFGATVVSCAVSLDGLKASYKGTVRGEDLTGTNRTIGVDATFAGTKGYIEVASTPGGTPTLRTWRVNPVVLHLTLSRELSLTSPRRKRFKEEVKKNFVSAANSFFYGDLHYALSNAVKFRPLPSL
ncbi:uncharacterized protein LOC135369408 [Ornithodoros turicata]|uniref:uncharacterized protein LOC135369408 n=1 Tax=Ornithodoros turicata TaxID=34597 RepID=UPI0031389998